MHGWGDTQAVSREEVASFCNADYLGKELHLCRTAYGFNDRPVSSTMLRPSSVGRAAGTGVPESDVTQELAHPGSVFGPGGDIKPWGKVDSDCASGLYAPASPVCEAANVWKRSPGAPGLIEYGEVVSFCDVETYSRQSEVCRAAYHFADAPGDGTP